MADVFLSLGSNTARYRHLTIALDSLTELFGPLKLSRVYESESVGFRGSLFLNMAVGFSTDMPLSELAVQMRAIELNNGRQLDALKFSPRTLDIDILSYGELCGYHAGIELPREEILYNAFVLLPLSELAPNHRHPLDGRSYQELWRAYASDQKLWPVSFLWQGRDLSAT
ncbi:2-amino-4-hydroxy-6-hydroxymethyldihydropteridinepyrophosphokinase [Zhongshania aliphaticivorans]|uniref:2-amino-4-hydroxy-6-hydroxymethyldihydropteridine diphosphokinase n=1 Tax=Zhongshania aliphaticivorans TaxID=1470434 RepID=A0A5S9Q5F4_9GAMM|nr:2-amino-4-hydroxy-6-hydroxymethyldihydropteridine diphosphokinase [Zhongshania aliphaticivorans]CAA0095173.1 2-amino-4-hydroxy-6-hydroxymethyldihydropteridinepyrophosphokinase [Zhongshania aliphaticivorans]CAA0112959.1 2-amino-4-hydroxy-6-hydroxymethyldihydropteridinepyrophosphokinase [Zhongshania aliphaticivorans]